MAGAGFHQRGDRAAALALEFETGSAQHLHIYGPPGVGKTRFALELCREAPWSASVVHLQQVSDMRLVELIDGAVADAAVRLVVVADEIQPEQLRPLRDAVARAHGRIRLVTVGRSLATHRSMFAAFSAATRSVHTRLEAHVAADGKKHSRIEDHPRLSPLQEEFGSVALRPYGAHGNARWRHRLPLLSHSGTDTGMRPSFLASVKLGRCHLQLRFGAVLPIARSTALPARRSYPSASSVS